MLSHFLIFHINYNASSADIVLYLYFGLDQMPGKQMSFTSA